MQILVRVVQVALALLSLAGGSFKVFSFAELATMPATAALPRSGWMALGVFEMLRGLLLIVGAATKSIPMLTPIVATALALENLALAVLFARYSLDLAATNPLVWVVAMAVTAAFVAYGQRRTVTT